jgi:hypothetical protein
VIQECGRRLGNRARIPAVRRPVVVPATRWLRRHRDQPALRIGPWSSWPITARSRRGRKPGPGPPVATCYAEDRLVTAADRCPSESGRTASSTPRPRGPRRRGRVPGNATAKALGLGLGPDPGAGIRGGNSDLIRRPGRQRRVEPGRVEPGRVEPGRVEPVSTGRSGRGVRQVPELRCDRRHRDPNLRTPTGRKHPLAPHPFRHTDHQNGCRSPVRRLSALRYGPRGCSGCGRPPATTKGVIAGQAASLRIASVVYVLTERGTGHVEAGVRTVLRACARP